MVKRQWACVFGGLFLVTLVACGRSKENDDASGDSMDGAASDDGETSTNTGGNTSSAGPSVGGSPGAGGSNTGAGGDAGAPPGSTGDDGTGGTGAGGGGGTGADGGGGTGTGGSSADELCEWGTYDTDLTDDELTCEKWSVCGPGTFQAEFGDSRNDRLCEACPEGTWHDQVLTFGCTPWLKCSFGQEEVAAPSSVEDRVCAPADVFTEAPFNYEEDVGALVVNDAGVYLAAGGGILGYSLDGEYLGGFGHDQAHFGIADVAAIGSELFLSGSKSVRDTEAGVGHEPGFVKKFNAEGVLVWEHEVAADARDHVTSVRIASHDDVVYAVAKVEDRLCTLTVDGGTVCPGSSSGPSRLVLSVVDTQGEEVSYETLEEDTNVYEVHSIAVASDGQLYVGASRSVLHFADNCDELAEEADPLYYYYYCQTGVAVWRSFLLQFDGTELVAEHDLGDSGGQVVRVRAGAIGGAHAMVLPVDWKEETVLYRMSASGELSEETVALEGDQISVFALTETGFVLAGRAETGPLLVRTDAEGQVVAREVLEDIEVPLKLTGLQEADDGRVFLGGFAQTAAFVVPWPE